MIEGGAALYMINADCNTSSMIYPDSLLKWITTCFFKYLNIHTWLEVNSPIYILSNAEQLIQII